MMNMRPPSRDRAEMIERLWQFDRLWRGHDAKQLAGTRNTCFAC